MTYRNNLDDGVSRAFADPRDEPAHQNPRAWVWIALVASALVIAITILCLAAMHRTWQTAHARELKRRSIDSTVVYYDALLGYITDAHVDDSIRRANVVLTRFQTADQPHSPLELSAHLLPVAVELQQAMAEVRTLVTNMPTENVDLELIEWTRGLVEIMTHLESVLQELCDELRSAQAAPSNDFATAASLLRTGAAMVKFGEAGEIHVRYLRSLVPLRQRLMEKHKVNLPYIRL